MGHVNIFSTILFWAKNDQSFRKIVFGSDFYKDWKMT